MARARSCETCDTRRHDRLAAPTRRCASASSRACPAPLSTWTWRLMRKPENGGGIATVVSARTCSSRASPNQSLRKDWLAADADPPRATCATPRRATPLRTSCKDMACPRAAVMAALRLELPSCMAASCARPRPSAACSNNVSKDSNSTDSIKACPRCAASGRHTSLMACPPGLPPQARQQPAGPANTGGTRWQARLAHPGSATAGRNRSAPCWTP